MYINPAENRGGESCLRKQYIQMELLEQSTYLHTGGIKKMILEVEIILQPGGEHVPAGFKLGVTRLAVREVVDRWLASDHSYFKVLADDGSVYILRHDKVENKWELTLFSKYGAGS